ncbi:kinase-like domain-containing protein [Lasiosphaeris hirsuta]|uniref:Kinase-like domain-containing protein n=1 Tax=Lasiosphaeris hirsuta TaxID=260670 RepID=A0AA40E4X1_9PEZI|nr:kinase-like domain-containing protein [Lasiosphaeris hirsuta]
MAMDFYSASLTSTSSWNTPLSRTSISALTHPFLSNNGYQTPHGLDDVIQAVRALRLTWYRYEELRREEVLGEVETYLVEKCAIKRDVFAVKHVKLSDSPDINAFRRRLKAIIFEVQIMRHGPLREHPNILSVNGYGWNMKTDQSLPYLVVEYAPMGSLREYLALTKRMATSQDVEILTGDVAAGLSALHTCGIIHGDVKLDNVLAFASYGNPVGALAKLTDFGHSIVTNTRPGNGSGQIPRYRGTPIYNAPEVRNQDSSPIGISELSKCDAWAFGLLIWEVCIGGRDYLSYARKHALETNPAMGDAMTEHGQLLRLAKQAVPVGVGLR